MFSLDVVRWRDRQQPLQPARQLRGSGSRQSLPDERLEGDGDVKDPDAPTLPSVHQLTQAKRDKRLKKLYGRTQKEMHDAYVERVGQWMQAASSKPWVRDYAKQASYSKEYVPRERLKSKEIGGPMLKTNLYSPRGVFKGGGECVRSLIESDPSAPQEEREEYREAIRFIEKTREKDKEIQPPMSVPKNKSLECAHYFVTDVICETATQNQRPPTRLARPSSRKQLEPLPTEPLPDHHHVQPPPTTGEYVAHPLWRVHSPERWMSQAFVSTVSSTNAHTAQNRSITGAHYAQSVLTSESFVPPHKRHPLSPKDAALNTRDHERRAQTAAASLRDTRSPRRQDRKYFTSMWTQPGSPSRVATVNLADDRADSPPRNGGRVLALQLREKASRGVASPRKSRSRTPRRPVLVRPLSVAEEASGPG